jgi:hypothetical protein
LNRIGELQIPELKPALRLTWHRLLKPEPPQLGPTSVLGARLEHATSNISPSPQGKLLWRRQFCGVSFQKRAVACCFGDTAADVAIKEIPWSQERQQSILASRYPHHEQPRVGILSSDMLLLTSGNLTLVLWLWFRGRADTPIKVAFGNLLLRRPGQCRRVAYLWHCAADDNKPVAALFPIWLQSKPKITPGCSPPYG